MMLNIVSWNCQSVSNKKPELLKYIDKHKIDIVLLSETWLSEKRDLDFHNFNCYRLDRSHGGVAILIKKSIEHNTIRRIKFATADAIFLKVKCLSFEFTVGSIYCSPVTSRSVFASFFSKVLSIPGAAIISGDFNCKHTRWNCTTNCLKGSDLTKICDSKLYQIHSPDSPTLIPSRGNPTIVDFVLSKAILGLTGPITDNELSSDHLPIRFSFPFQKSVAENTKIFDYKYANWKKFREIIERTTVELQQNCSLDNKGNIDKCIELVNEKITSAIEQSIPKKNPYIFRYEFSPEIHLLIRYRNYYIRKFKETLDPAFRSLKNQLNRMIKGETSLLNQKKFDEKIASLNTSDNSLFRLSKSLKNKKYSIPPLNLRRTTAYSSRDKAKFLARSFLDCHRTTSSMKCKNEKEVIKSARLLQTSKISFPPTELVKVKDVQEIVKYLKIRKASGPDKISNLVIKNLPLNFLKFLTSLFNSCFKNFYFPKIWKIGKIVAIPKAGKDHSNPKNYRPISLLSNFGKIFERLILNKLTNFELERKIIVPHQFGFRNNHSTVQQILRITEHATVNFNLNKSTGMVLLDIEKAFDSVWHDGLIHKLKKLGFPPYLNKLIQSFLKNRKAFVEIDNCPSHEYTIPAGVPQGSLLSPFLFNAFVNDIPKIKNCHLAMYADDTALYCDAPWKDIDNIIRTLGSGVTKLSNFFKSWKIKINSTKTEFSIFTRSTVMKNKMNIFPPIYNGNQLTWSTPVKYLGVHLDSRLSFKDHINNSIKKANKAIATLYCIMKKHNSSSIHSKLTLYKSYIRPLLTYACPVFQNCPKTHFRKLQVFQNKCLRMILSAQYDTRISDLHQETNVPTIREFVDKITENFYRKCSIHENNLINTLGDYNAESLAFRVKHPMPRQV
jgi:hypothetical protein